MPEDRFNRQRQRSFGLRRRPGSLAEAPAPGDVKRWTELAKNLPDMRFQKVQALREAIAAGTYNLESRLDDLLQNLPVELTGLDSDAT